MNPRAIIGAGVVAVLLTAAFTVAVKSETPAKSVPPIPVRVVYTASVFRDIAANDAKAAIKVWAETIASDLGINGFAVVDVASDIEDLTIRVEEDKADFCGTTIREYLEVEERLDPEPIFGVVAGATTRTEYILLVRDDSRVTTIEDLSGADLRLFDNARTSLAAPWLEILISESARARALDPPIRVSSSTKLSAVVLPVFFGQADACIVTENGFRTMSEMNPQVGKHLRVLARSPGLVPMVSFLRRDFNPPFRQDLIRSIQQLHTTTAGVQILNLMQGDGITALQSSDLETARDLHRRWTLHRETALAQGKPKQSLRLATTGGSN